MFSRHKTKENNVQKQTKTGRSYLIYIMCVFCCETFCYSVTKSTQHNSVQLWPIIMGALEPERNNNYGANTNDQRDWYSTPRTYLRRLPGWHFKTSWCHLACICLQSGFTDNWVMQYNSTRFNKADEVKEISDVLRRSTRQFGFYMGVLTIRVKSSTPTRQGWKYLNRSPKKKLRKCIYSVMQNLIALSFGNICMNLSTSFHYTSLEHH